MLSPHLADESNTNGTPTPEKDDQIKLKQMHGHDKFMAVRFLEKRAQVPSVADGSVSACMVLHVSSAPHCHRPCFCQNDQRKR
jgi:hypothetical protein